MQEVEVIEVLKNVQRYNRLFQGGINGVIRVGLHDLFFTDYDDEIPDLCYKSPTFM